MLMCRSPVTEHVFMVMVEPQIDGAIEIIPGRFYWAIYNSTPTGVFLYIYSCIDIEVEIDMDVSHEYIYMT